MGLFSALSVGVASLEAQSNNIDIISNNIANVNTVGYRQNQADFSELIANSSTPTTVSDGYINNTPGGYSPGGVMTTSENLNSIDGTITAASSATDIAINGNGFIPVSQTSADSGDIAYTRAGTFTEDANGDLVNSNGYYLQGWALDANGNPITGALEPVNVQTLTETPVPTSTVSIQANLDASAPVYAGSPPYNASDDTANMASGSVTPQFSAPITVIDSAGTAHTLEAGFLKTGTNTWAVEIYAQPASDVTAPDGQVAAGTITFNGDGTLASVNVPNPAPIFTSGGITPITINWGTAGAEFGTVGATTIGSSNGLSQFAEGFSVTDVQQNGVQPSALTSVSIGANGYVTGNYQDGNTRNLYQIPLANFVNPDGLQSITGDAFVGTTNSGTANYLAPGTSGAGVIDPSALESSNVDLSTQLTDLIVAQNAYQNSAQLVSTTNTMLSDLVQMGVATS